VISALLAFVVPVAPAGAATSAKPRAFPARLKWVRMSEATLNFNPKYPRPAEKREDVDAAKRIWNGGYEGYLKKNPDSGVFFLVGRIDGPSYKVTASVIDFPFHYVDDCERPSNGFKAVDQYSRCRARVELEGQGRVVSQEFKDFCYLNIDNDSENPLAKNHTEVAADEKTGTVYFRVIQYGKPVPACNRSVTFK
jgi:hypothetical protein